MFIVPKLNRKMGQNVFRQANLINRQSIVCCIIRIFPIYPKKRNDCLNSLITDLTLLLKLILMIKKIIILLTALAFPLNLIINYFYSKPLYSLGASLIIQMQKYSNPLLDYFFIFFTILVDPLLIITGCCIFMLVIKRKLTALITVIFILFNTYFLTISKSFYSAPRPYWTHHNVKNIGYYCPKDYGNPSGHAEFAAILASVFLFQFVDTKKQFRYTLIGALFMIAVCISRMYLGGHSLDQVSQGLFLGVSLSVLYTHGGVKEFIRDILVKQRRNSYKYKIILIVIVMHILYVWAYWQNNQKSNEHKKSAKIWVKNYNEKCGKNIDEHYLNLVMLNLNAILVNVITGLIFGFKNMLGVKNMIFFMKGQWNFNRKKYPNILIAYLTFIGVQVGLFSIGFIVFTPILLIQKNTTFMFIYYSLSCLVSSYLYSSWTLKIINRLELIQTGEQHLKDQ